jgi:hypothetical protein
MGQVIPNGRLQFPDAAEGPAPNSPIREQAKETLHLNRPTGADRREVQVITRSTSKPALNFGHFVSAVIIHRQMDVQGRREAAFNELLDLITERNAGFSEVVDGKSQVR